MMDVRDLGLIDYQDAWRIQQQTVARVIEDRARSFLLMCEHPAVLTLGRLADRRHILYSPQQLARQGVSVVPVDRGGEVTLHAPGQLVVYPILNLEQYGKDLHRYLSMLEEVGIDFLKWFKVQGNRVKGKTGVWAGERKLISVGIGVRKWISFHGLSINIQNDLALYQMIRPCGLDAAMTSLARETGDAVAMASAKQVMVEIFKKRFAL
ncbi:MAG TPA: lipoyl(octanoyl) transferase LipB [Candidatus Bathyarchaeia archaeon]|nr:lipoyl(octanoyl) transferase LipB [Candidatus Bathyarchaeia archaeon]